MNTRIPLLAVTLLLGAALGASAVETLHQAGIVRGSPNGNFQTRK